MGTRNDTLRIFYPSSFEGFSPDSDFNQGSHISKVDETYRIIGGGKITLSPYKGNKDKKIIFIQPSSLPSIRYAVIVPEGVLLADSITFFKRKTKKEKQRVRINRNKKRKDMKWCLCNHPKNETLMPWRKTLLYEKNGKKWVLIEVDGKLV